MEETQINNEQEVTEQQVEQTQSVPNQTVIINQQVQPQKKGNGIGTAGFVIAIIALFLSWIPVFGWILWALGVIFSFVGVFKRPKGLSIAGLIISFIGIILLLTISAGIMASMSM